MQVARQAETVYVQVVGRGSFQNASHVKSFCEETVKSGVSHLIIDLKECTYLDSTFLGTLAGVGLKLRTVAGGTLEVINASPRNAELIQNLGLDRLFRFHLKPVQCGVPSVSTRPLEPLQALENEPAGKIETGETMLEAHETLMHWDPRNVPKFKDVVAYLKEDLGQKVA